MKLTADFIKVNVEPAPYTCSIYGLENETNEFNMPTLDRVYVKILQRCQNEVLSARDLYPNTKNPLMSQVRDMCRMGLLQRYMNPNIMNGRKYFYGTTNAGRVIIRIAERRSHEKVCS